MIVFESQKVTKSGVCIRIWKNWSCWIMQG